MPSIMPRCTSDENTECRRLNARLRAISVWTFIPAFAFNVAHGAVFHSVLPALGLIPHAFSVGLAVYELRWWEWVTGKPGYRLVLQEDGPEDLEGDKKSLLHASIIAALDAVFGISLTVCIVGAYITICQRTGYDYYHYYDAAGLNILGTYATLPYIVNA